MIDPFFKKKSLKLPNLTTTCCVSLISLGGLSFPDRNRKGRVDGRWGFGRRPRRRGKRRNCIWDVIYE